MSEWQHARLIPVSGIGATKEAEARATSALLAVIAVVRDLSAAILGPIGATKAKTALVDCYTEVIFKNSSSNARPDGLIQVTRGSATWTALVEVKTGTATLDADQINTYWDIARTEGYDAVLTISNEIAPSPGTHPTPGLKVRSNSKTKVAHLSWPALLTACEVIREHRGVDDPEQAWILGELIRYLRHPNSGADPFDDMGPDWVSVRDGARDKTLSKSDASVAEVARRWDQLMRYTALRLEASIGETVALQLPAAHKDPAARLQHVIDQLASTGQLDALLRIPNTAGDLDVQVDLRARRITTSVSVTAPQDRGAKARCTWIARQIDADADGRIVVEAFPKRSNRSTSATLDAVRTDKDVLLGDEKREPGRFRLSISKDIGVARKTSKSAVGFIDSVVGQITSFYGTVLEDLTPWTPPAPRITRQQPDVDPEPTHTPEDGWTA